MKIRSDILRTYQSVHTWTGITTGLLLFIAFFTGALTMFKSPITQWAIPSNEVLAQVPKEKVDTLIKQAADEFPAVNKGFTLHFDQHHSPLTWYESGGGRGLHTDSQLRHATLNEEGELVSFSAEQNVLGELIDQLHRTAGIPGKAGHEDIGVLVLGLASALYFVAIVSGVIFLLPTLVKSFFSLRQNKGASRFWLDTHNLIGITSLPFHLLIAWTVVVFAFHDLFYDGLALVYGDEPMFNRNGGSQQVYNLEQLPTVGSYFDAIKDVSDGYQVTSLSFENLDSPRAALTIELLGNGQLQRTYEHDIIRLQPFSMEVITSTLNTEENGIYGPIVKSFFALHFGNFANNAGRWIYFILGMMGAVLFYTGNLLWLEKRRKKQNRQSASVTVMAKLTVGVCLGSMLGVAATLLASKWLYMFGISANTGYISIYYVTFVSSLLFSFWRGAARAAILLQYLLAAICVGIPVTSILTLPFDQEPYWPIMSVNSITISILSLIFAALFYRGAIITRQRAFYGSRNSIWAINPPTDSPEKHSEPVTEK